MLNSEVQRGRQKNYAPAAQTCWGIFESMFQENEILNGTYQILRPIGQGGLGVVYLAYHIRLQKYVVVKRITRNFSGNLAARTEVDILKDLHHPNLPQVYDFVQDYRSVYTVIDYVEGDTLDTYIQAGTVFTEQQLMRWFRQIVEVLVYLHNREQPVLHTDIKPGNIIINPNGDAVLIDFNISIGADSEGVLGYSLPYASPEQIEIARASVAGHSMDYELDARTDIYSLGACFYRLISGDAPAINEESYPLAQMGLDFNEAFLRVIDKAMQPDREQRYASAKKLLNALDKAKRQNQQYRTYLLCQCAALLLGAVLVGSGLYCLIVGEKKEKVEKFGSEIAAVYSCYSAGDSLQAERGCLEVLNYGGYDKLLQENPGERCHLLYILGDISYEKEDYDTAVSQYEQALTYAQTASDRSACFRGCVSSYAESGNLTMAQEKLQMAKEAGIDSNSLLFLDVILNARSGNTQECLDSAVELLQRCGDYDLCSRACIAAARAAQDTSTEIEWLEAALQYGKKRTVLRGLTVAYAQLAKENGTQSAAAAALSYGEMLVKETYALKTDWLNYAAVQQLNGRNNEAVKTLNRLLEEYPNDYLVLMNLAFAYDSLGDAARAKKACNDAISAWKADVSPEKLPSDSEEIQDLMTLWEKLK